MTRRRISKASKRRLTIFGTLSLVAIGYFIFSLIYNIYTIYDLTMVKKKSENLYSELIEQGESLKIDLEKLNDSTYLANYAREHFLYSKNGEYIIQIEDLDELDNNIDSEINKNYIIIGLSIFMIFVFMYIFAKGKKGRKK